MISGVVAAGIWERAGAALSANVATASAMAATGALFIALNPGRDLRQTVIVVFHVVSRRNRSDRHGDAEPHVDRAWQPHVGERLRHAHRGAKIVEAYERSTGQELEIHVVEGVLNDLMLCRFDPERDERHLIHLLF